MVAVRTLRTLYGGFAVRSGKRSSRRWSYPVLNAVNVVKDECGETIVHQLSFALI